MSDFIITKYDKLFSYVKFDGTKESIEAIQKLLDDVCDNVHVNATLSSDGILDISNDKRTNVPSAIKNGEWLVCKFFRNGEGHEWYCLDSDPTDWMYLWK